MHPHSTQKQALTSTHTNAPGALARPRSSDSASFIEFLGSFIELSSLSSDNNVSSAGRFTRFSPSPVSAVAGSKYVAVSTTCAVLVTAAQATLASAHPLMETILTSVCWRCVFLRVFDVFSRLNARVTRAEQTRLRRITSSQRHGLLQRQEVESGNAMPSVSFSPSKHVASKEVVRSQFGDQKELANVCNCVHDVPANFSMAPAISMEKH